ncbi:hypothetical protein ACHAWF_014926 [Thalassiosira exigua]
MADSVAQMNATAAEERGEKQMIYRYESPFIPKSNDCERMPSALIILNTPIKSSLGDDGRLSGVLGILWDASNYCICADGGANRLYDATVALHESDSGEASSANYLPDVITGDLDSLRPDVHRYYEKRGVSIVRIQDQNFHDLDKSLMAVESWIGQRGSISGFTGDESPNNCMANKSRVFVYGGFGGRFDQEMGVINALCVWGKKAAFDQTMLAAYDEETCAFQLPELPLKSELRIRFPSGNIRGKTMNKVGEGPTCGLIPMFGRCDNVTTTGLKWNLAGDVPLEFGGLVSSSNYVLDEIVTVESSASMLFTTEMIVE